MKKILIVGDVVLSPLKMRGIYDRAGFVLMRARDAQAAMNVYRRDGADLIVMAFELPTGKRGDQFCRQVRNDPDLRNVSVIIVCGEHDIDAKLAERAGPNAVFKSPVDFIALERKIIGLLNVNVRKAFRVVTHVQVEGEYGGVQIVSTMENLSSTGALIESNRPLTVGSAINLSFVLPGGRRLQVKGEVVRCVDKAPGRHHYGLKFGRLNASDQNALDKFIEGRKSGG